MKIKTSKLIGKPLDFAVARALDYKPVLETESTGPDFWICQVPWGGYEMIGEDGFSPSTDWSQGGELIQRYGCDLICIAPANAWEANCWDDRVPMPGLHNQEGETPLIAAMRAIVSAKLGDEVDVPEELL